MKKVFIIGLHISIWVKCVKQMSHNIAIGQMATIMHFFFL